LGYEWGTGFALAVGVAAAVYALTHVLSLAILGDVGFWKTTVAPVLAGGALGAWMGSSVARQMGWRPPWTTGAITAVVMEAVLYGVGSALLR
jgi:uncharacterized membrane protein YfcA